MWRSFWAAPVFSGAFGFDATAALITRLRTRSINLPMEAPARRISGVVFLCIAALASVVVFTIRSSKHDLAEGVSAIPGPSVERVSVVITQGTNHTFYYRGRLAWEANRLFKFLRLPIHTGAERRQVSNESCDMLWLTFAITPLGSPRLGSDRCRWQDRQCYWGRRTFRQEATCVSVHVGARRGIREASGRYHSRF